MSPEYGTPQAQGWALGHNLGRKRVGAGMCTVRGLLAILDKLILSTLWFIRASLKPLLSFAKVVCGMVCGPASSGSSKNCAQRAAYSSRATGERIARQLGVTKP